MTIESLWIYPPLAFGRLGGSDTPLEGFQWGLDQNTPRGSGRTTILPALALRVADDGTVTSYVPECIQFKDDQGFRPVCPFFELHARCVDADGKVTEVPVTQSLLDRYNLPLGQLAWSVDVANLKPFNMAEDPDAR